MLTHREPDFFTWLLEKAYRPVPQVLWLLVIFIECLTLALKAAS